MAPETRYARSGKVNIAYQVTTEGPLDLVYVLTKFTLKASFFCAKG
jgi:hypothetical protein